MEHPVSDTYLDIQTVRVSNILPAAGAYDPAPVAIQCPGFKRVTFYVTYTRGGAGGAVDFKVEAKRAPTSLTVWHQLAQYSSGALTAGTDTTSNVQREEVRYQATGAAAERFVFGPIDLEGTVEQIRVSCQESGAVATPGTCEIIAQFS